MNAPIRVRQDFSEDRAECRKRRQHVLSYRALRLNRSVECKLPEECEFCRHWVCNACEQVVPWSNGGGEDMTDGGGKLCDECWCKYIRDWLVEQELIEAKKLESYDNAFAL